MSSRECCSIAAWARSLRRPQIQVCFFGQFAAMNCNSSKISEFGQKLGGKLAVICARPSHSRQAFVDGHDWQQRSAVVYNKPKRGNTPPLGSMPRHCITLEAWVVRCSSVVEVGMIVFSSLSILRKNIGS